MVSEGSPFVDPKQKNLLGKGASVYEILCRLFQKLVHLSHVSGFVTG